ncbi:MAG: transposase [Candidatus Muproteobacteria bacterium RIFCSPHIGHO2_12_FULL_60_33]|uniref:Transposase n=1 Tax=Candidatus Muproteobacteria bacterium RIFCSPLOWO2_01_FULL_60_18 TaxID=1817768 RepID=A0A1F6TYM4_9PROT|nr:MAG: transposase [Candidatus Muproteobacteria bacterium RIFCSPLOWO2_01_FULL_60_18]OGI53710.1 MAG: transposase [Candidatus Muproteobacteria bacterium RIFCSPHIGHO2_01_60_12]OGI53747.1 MAG: transposase [Candidatus Muproteobacteria bacterium RIFCSPHIGHO2_02_FULL_60_13]OGI56044.1 MAG: transposase [Candidatus Muproteobacteria bacterium RIFCSPHIGHO2_12_FULL_60_33]
MMGHHSGNQNRLFYSFHLDDHVPPNHLLRGIDRFLDLSDLRQHLSPYYSHTGRPSIDPELLIRMLIVGYCFGIRSERRLCEEAHLNLAYRWFCRLGLEDPVPDHSSFSKNRHGRFRDSDTLRFVFERVLDRCLREGLVGGEGFAIDASVVKADANRQRGLPGNDIDWSRVSAISRPVREYLAALDEADGEKKVPKNISLTDPAAQWTAAPGGPAFYAYSTNYLVDTHAGIVVDVEATPAYRSDEVNATKTMIDRVEHRLGKKPQRLIGDTAYGTAALLGWMVDEKKIEPHVPVWDKSERSDGTFGRSSFIFDAEHNRYVCPAGKFLKTAWRSRKKDPFRYRASLYDCQPCALKARCSPNMAIRKIDRSPHESARDVARALAKTEAYQQSRKDRKKVEMLFAHLKRILKLDRLRLRGLSGAQDEFLLAATAQNLRRMVKWLAPPAPEPPWIPA